MEGRKPKASGQIRTPGWEPPAGWMKAASQVPSGVLISTSVSTTDAAAEAEPATAKPAATDVINSRRGSPLDDSSFMFGSLGSCAIGFLLSDSVSPPRPLWVLLRAALESLGQGLNFVNAHRGVSHAIRSFDLLPVRVQRADAGGVQRLLAGPGERHADDGARRWNHAQIFSIGVEHLDAVGRVEDTSHRIDGHAVAISAAFQLAEFPLIFDRTIRLHIVGHDHHAVGDV